jgi:CO/xanthine dehydrogenase Mo-binding subunit
MTAPAAIANALSDALSVDVDQLPASPARVWSWLLEARRA